MGKVTNQELAELISKRILEIIDLAGLTVESLADFAGVSSSTIRSICRKTGSVSVDSLAKICEPFAIDLTDFFDSAKLLTIEGENLPHLKEFKEHLFTGRETKTPVSPMENNNSQSDYHRQQRDLIAYIVYRSDYFNVPKTLEEMVVDFRKDYKATLTVERLYSLLLKYLGRGVLEKKAVPRASRRMPASKRPFLYFKRDNL